MSLRRLAVVTAATTYLLVAVGGLVRATESGLGCGDDWPRCSGRLIPEADFHAWVEYSHRALASVVIVLTILLAVTALRARRAPAPGREAPTGTAVRLAVATVPLVLAQALLGAIVVILELHAESVVAHLLLAMTLLAVLISLVIETQPSLTAGPGAGAPARSGSGSPDRHFARLVTVAAGSTLALMLLGSYVSGRGAGLAFTDWPLFGGRLIPAIHGVLPDLHFAHRLLAAIVAVVIFALARLARRRTQAPAVARLVRVAAALIGVEILIGAGNVWTRLGATTRTAHLAVGALIWATLFAAARLAWRLPAPGPVAPGPAGAPHPQPARAPVRSAT